MYVSTNAEYGFLSERAKKKVKAAKSNKVVPLVENSGPVNLGSESGNNIMSQDYM